VSKYRENAPVKENMKSEVVAADAVVVVATPPLFKKNHPEKV
jgi:hypothetical protein